MIAIMDMLMNTHTHTEAHIYTASIQPGFSRDSRECPLNETFCKEKVEHEC